MRFSTARFQVANASNEAPHAHGLTWAGGGITPDIVLEGNNCQFDATFAQGVTAPNSTNTFWDNASGGALWAETLALLFDHSIESPNLLGGSGFGTGYSTVTGALGAGANVITHGLLANDGVTALVPDIAFIHGRYNRALNTSLTRGALTSTSFTVTVGGAGGGVVSTTFLAFHSIQGGLTGPQVGFATLSVPNGTNAVAHGMTFTPELVLVDGSTADRDVYWNGAITATTATFVNGSGGPVNTNAYFFARHSMFAST